MEFSVSCFWESFGSKGGYQKDVLYRVMRKGKDGYHVTRRSLVMLLPFQIFHMQK